MFLALLFEECEYLGTPVIRWEHLNRALLHVARIFRNAQIYRPDDRSRGRAPTKLFLRINGNGQCEFGGKVPRHIAHSSCLGRPAPLPSSRINGNAVVVKSTFPGSVDKPVDWPSYPRINGNACLRIFGNDLRINENNVTHKQERLANNPERDGLETRAGAGVPAAPYSFAFSTCF